MDILLSQQILFKQKVHFFMCCISHFPLLLAHITFNYHHGSIGSDQLTKQYKKSHKEVKFKEGYLRNILALPFP